MRIDAANLPPVDYIVMSRVNPVVSVTHAPQSGVRPQDLNKLMRMSTYDERGNVKTTNMVTNFGDIFNGGKIDVRA
ncbi:hypothetical protein [Athalassotoga saccharophila]|uniref:hypothetical protein n=1 Tax=Athalassotoga saccharophila TaxID=1441386 RepID=UPI001379444B|nr:hypothetical protein [Athalassotoga saccharophila]BBJ28277.1 hypothetical protein ATHSA_1180 [Athalassotoga saccharophila]